MAPYLLEKEKRFDTYTHLYEPLISCSGSLSSNFEGKIRRDFNQIHSPAHPATESLLVRIIANGKDWLLNFAQKNILMVPGNLRAGLQTFEGGEVNEVSQRSIYTMQHFPTTILPDLVKLLSFAYRRGHFTNKSKYGEHDPFFVPYFLKNLLLEKPDSVSQYPFLAEFCLMSVFRVKHSDSTISMVNCDTLSSLFSRIISVCRAAVCSVICSFTQEAFFHGRQLVDNVRKAPVSHIISPMIRQLREMAQQIPQRQKSILDSSGNIIVDQYSFPYDDWSRIVPMAVSQMYNILPLLANGSWWETIVDPATPIKVRVNDLTGEISLVDVEPNWNLASCLPHDQLHYFIAILKMAFHGFGGGSARMSELEEAQPTMLHCLFCNHTIYYTMASLKGFKSSSAHGFKKVARKLPPVISRFFLLFRSLVHSDANSSFFVPSDSLLIFPKPNTPSSFGVQHVMKNIFNLDSCPNMRQIRQFWACVSNFLTGDSGGNNYLTASASSIAASKFGHSERTHAVSYASKRLDGDETHFNAFHFGIGDTSHDIVMLQSTALSLGDIRSAMNLRYPKSLSVEGHKYLSIQQKDLVEFAYGPSSNNPLHHCFGLLAPGQGKSESYIIPTIARRLANQKGKMIIHVSPYSFLSAYQFELATAAVDSVGFASSISICVFKGCDFMEGCLPEELSDSDALPNLLFVNLDAMSNLFNFHFEALKSWVPFMDKIVLDEVHTIYSELSFREKYKVCPKLPILGIPILVLSGSVPLFALPRLAHRLCLSVNNDLSDVKVIHGADIVGDFPRGFVIRFSVSDTYLTKVATFVVKRYGGGGSFHLFVSTKDEGDRLFQLLSSRCCDCDCIFISGKTSRDELNNVASKWRRGAFRVLISTSIALVGNENPMCRYIACAGVFYDSMQLVQAFGRLRTYMRISTGMIYFAAHEKLSAARILEDEHRLTRLVNEKLVSYADVLNFKATMTSGGVHQWHMNAYHGQVGCALKILSSSFGKIRTNCGACPFCRNIPITTTQSEAATRIANERRNEQSTERVLARLALTCLVCKKDCCRGLPILKTGQINNLLENVGCCFPMAYCYQCGVSRHKRAECCDKSYMYRTACCECWVFKNVPGYVRHEKTECQVKGRLRRLLSDYYIRFKVVGSFKDYLEGIYTSSSTFCEFIYSIDVKYNNK
jgi:superfamily II DNA helicase RecQ